MSHFAKVVNGVVEDILVVDKETIDSGVLGDPSLWIQTSYNTRHGIYYTPNTNTPDADQSKALRMNFASIGGTYDYSLDIFIEPKPPMYNSWILDTNTGTWVPPIPKPTNINIPEGDDIVWMEKDLKWYHLKYDLDKGEGLLYHLNSGEFYKKMIEVELDYNPS